MVHALEPDQAGSNPDDVWVWDLTRRWRLAMAMLAIRTPRLFYYQMAAKEETETLHPAKPRFELFFQNIPGKGPWACRLTYKRG